MYTYINSSTAPDDYRSLVTTLTFQKGATGMLASEARCVGVFIFDDNEPEQNETLSFFLRSPNNNTVRIMPGRERKQIHIVDNDG